jgi:hypothetical protein
MNRLIRVIVAGGVVGAAVGVAMLMRKPGMMAKMQPQSRTSGTLRMVRNKAIRITSAVKDGTEAFSRGLARRVT